MQPRNTWSPVRRVACLALGAALLSGCTGAGSSGPTSMASTPSWNDADPVGRGTLIGDPGPVSSTAPASSFHAEPLVLLSSTQATGLTSLPWGLVKIHSGAQDVDIAYIAGGGCTRWQGVEVIETATSVAIAALARTTDPPANGACAADLRFGATTLRLTTPLGNRKLLHAEVDTSWRSFAQYVG